MTTSLGEAADCLSEALERAERVIVSRRFCVRASVDLYGANRERLAFGKSGGAWCLFLEHADGSEKPLLSAPFVVRLRAAAKIPELVETLRKVSREQTADMVRAASDLDKYMCELESEP